MRSHGMTLRPISRQDIFCWGCVDESGSSSRAETLTGTTADPCLTVKPMTMPMAVVSVIRRWVVADAWWIDSIRPYCWRRITKVVPEIRVSIGSIGTKQCYQEQECADYFDFHDS
jgi:hypothetical protein